MTQKSFHWNGASVGDADSVVENAADGIGYRLGNSDYVSPFVDTGLRMLYNGDENRGVLYNWRNGLAVTGAVLSVNVATGGAIVYGMPYENTAIVNVAFSAPTTDTRYDRIVLRRDWTAQTIRITRIAGVEGGGLPAITQSPAPVGTGIYDVPLASFSVTTGGVITVTDEREYCQYGGVPGANSMDTAQLNTGTVQWADRETRIRTWFVGGGCFRPMNAAGLFYYMDGAITFSNTPTWGGGGNAQSWQLNGITYEGVGAKVVCPPPDYATGDVLSYIWWAPNAGAASTFYIRSAIQGQCDNNVLWGATGYSSTYINETTVANRFYRTQGWTISAAVVAAFSALSYPYGALYYLAYWYNSAGAEDINILGVEFQYTGYV